MKPEVIFLAHRVPYPPNRGDKIRSWNILRRIAEIAPVHVCALWDDPRDLEHRAVLEGVAASVTFARADLSRASAIVSAVLRGGPASVAACASAELQARVDALLASRPIGCIYSFSGQMAQFVPNPCEVCFVMDFVDMDSAKFEAFGGLAAREEARRLFAWEKETAARADLSLFVSNGEKALFADRTGMDHVEALENGVDLDSFNPALAFPDVGVRRPAVIFTGQMDYRPNIEAVAQFAREAMPLVRSSVAETSFYIVGRNPAAEVIALRACDGVHVTGEVPDTRDWLAAAHVVVAPLLLARGVQNKVLEAMAMAKAVVASSPAAEGIDATPGIELVVADGPEAQAEAVIELLRNPEQAARIGAAARARIVARYSWDARLAELPRILGLGHATVDSGEAPRPDVALS